MSVPIIHKKSSVPDRVPEPEDLVYGELALNYADGKLFFKDSTNAIQSFNAGAGGSGGISESLAIAYAVAL